MPQNITDASTWTTPIVMPTDTDPADLTYIAMAVQGLANRTLELADRIGGAGGGGEWVYPSGSEPGRIVYVSLDDLRWATAADGTTPQWSLNRDPSASAEANSRSDFGVAVLPLTPYLRHGMILSEVKLAMKPGAARAGSNRALAGVWREVPDFATVGKNPVSAAIVGAVKYDDATANKQFLTLATAEIGDPVISRSTGSYKLGIFAGSDGGGGHQADKVYGIRLSFIDPGPSNF